MQKQRQYLHFSTMLRAAKNKHHHEISIFQSDWVLFLKSYITLHPPDKQSLFVQTEEEAGIESAAAVAQSTCDHAGGVVLFLHPPPPAPWMEDGAL